MPLFSLYAPLMRIFGQHQWVLCWPRRGAMGTTLRHIQDLGAPPPHLVALADGPPLDAALRHRGTTWLAPVGAPPADLYGEFLAWERAAAAVAPAALDGIDPARQAQVLAPAGTALAAVGGRPVWGAAPLALRHRLEDKTLVGAVLDAAGVARAPDRVVPLSAAADAAAALDQGQGTVWAGDARDGIEGGAVATRWVHDARSQAAAVAALGAPTRQVRVMPFLAGVPCAVQGFCTPTGTAVFEPMEMGVLATRETGQFHFCGMATLWDAPPALRDAMRAATRRVGDHIRRAHGWRGGFSLDGIATLDGPQGPRFWPTELNARFSGGLSRLDAIHGGPPLALAHRALWAGLSLDLDAAALERSLGAAARRRRVCGLRWATPALPPDGTAPLPLGDDSRVAWDDGGGFGLVKLIVDPLARQPGPPVGPELARALRRARDHFALDIPALWSPAESA